MSEHEQKRRNVLVFLKVQRQCESRLLCVCLCNALSPPFISSSGIIGSSDQFLLMLFCCHGHQVLQYAPWYCVYGTALCVLIDTAAQEDHCHFTEASRILTKLKTTNNPFFFFLTTSVWTQCVPQLSNSYFNLINYSSMSNDTHHGPGNTFKWACSLLHKDTILFK